MNEEKTTVNIRIYGTDYNFVGIESEEYIQKVCLYVDKKMRETAKDMKNVSLSTLSVLSAVNISDEYHKTKALLNETTDNLKKYKEDAFNFKSKNAVLEKENEFLKDEIQSLKIQLAKYEK